jgi:hypothetical protein
MFIFNILFLFIVIKNTSSTILEFDITLQHSPKDKTNNLTFLEEDEFSTNDIHRTNENYYILNFNIGIPSQKFELMLDTGSCIMWIGEKNAEGIDHRKKYDTGVSKYY